MVTSEVDDGEERAARAIAARFGLPDEIHEGRDLLLRLFPLLAGLLFLFFGYAESIVPASRSSLR